MAAALSRALKLPGKKGSDLGEYDPLTQADSEDDSEEDDLVLNYPRNGLETRTRTRTRLGDVDEELEEEEEEEEERREGRGSGSGAGLEGSGGVAGAVQVGDLEGKQVKVRGAVRTAMFLVPLACAMLTVLLCAFLLPCRQEAPPPHLHWETHLGDVTGVSSPPVALWDVDGDGLEDLLISVTKISNNSQLTSSLGNSKEYSVVALSGQDGQMMWTRPLKEPVSSLQCGLQTSVLEDSQRDSLPPVCLLITPSHLTAINASSGKQLWDVPAGEVESRAVAVPDLQGDNVPDLLIITLPADQESDLSLVLHSGMTGSLIGRPVNFNLTAQGKLIGPLLHETAAGAFYILFGLGTVEGVSLRDIYRKATGRTAPPPSISLKDPHWEKLRKTNQSTLIHISSGGEQVECVLPLVAGQCNNRDNLDVQSNQNRTHTDLVLLSSSSQLSIIRESNLITSWTFSSSSIHSRPAVGHFNDDGVPDLFIQQSANGVRKVQVIDGVRGVCVWEVEFVCPRLVLEASSILTSAGLSVFVFWAGDPLTPSNNYTKVSTPEPVLRRLFLLHPAYPTILQELFSTTDTALTATVSYQEVMKDCRYVLVLSRPVSGVGLGAEVVKSVSVRAALGSASTVWLGQNKPSDPLTPTTFQINKFFRQITFRQQ